MFHGNKNLLSVFSLALSDGKPRFHPRIKSGGRLFLKVRYSPLRSL